MKTTPVLNTLSIVAGALFAFSNPSHGLIISDDVDFSVNYQAASGLLPSAATPVWTRVGSAGGTTGSTLISGALVFNTPLSGDRIFRIQNSTGNWDGSTTTGSTIEFSLKVESVAPEAAAATSIYFSTGTRGYIFHFNSDSILYGSASVAHDTTVVFQRYRITLDPDGNANLYANDNATPLISGYFGTTPSITTNHIYFGDPGGTVGGIAHWEYIAYTNAGAVAPVPEVTTLSMALFGGVLLIAGRRWLCLRRGD